MPPNSTTAPLGEAAADTKPGQVGHRGGLRVRGIVADPLPAVDVGLVPMGAAILREPRVAVLCRRSSSGWRRRRRCRFSSQQSRALWSTCCRCRWCGRRRRCSHTLRWHRRSSRRRQRQSRSHGWARPSHRSGTAPPGRISGATKTRSQPLEITFAAGAAARATGIAAAPSETPDWPRPEGRSGRVPHIRLRGLDDGQRPTGRSR